MIAGDCCFLAYYPMTSSSGFWKYIELSLGNSMAIIGSEGQTKNKFFDWQRLAKISMIAKDCQWLPMIANDCFGYFHY